MPNNFRQRCGALWRLAATAASLLLAPTCGHAQNITYSEVDLGVLDHDAQFLGGKEKGVDLNPEVKFQSPIDDATMSRVPPAFRWMAQPRPTVGLVVNTAGFTNQFYVGATWTWQLFGNVMMRGDGITAGLFFGPGLNDGQIHSTQPDRKSLGSNLLFREAVELGYRFGPTYSVSAYLDHISNGGFARYNQSINDFGARFGVRF